MKRDNEQYLKDFVSRKEEHKNVLIVEGARQVGKTYFIQDFLSRLSSGLGIVQVNLEKDPMLRNKIDSCVTISDLNLALREVGFNPNAEQIIFIDEAQESKALGALVRGMKEDWINKSVILSGSSMARLFTDQRVPVGRIEYLRIYPYCFREFMRAQEKEYLLQEVIDSHFLIKENIHRELLSYYDNFLRIGGMPRVVTSYAQAEPRQNQDNIRFEIFLSQQDDFYRNEPLIKGHLFKDAIYAASNSLGFPFSLTKIANGHRDARRILDLLALWHILLPCEQKSLTSTSSFHPKVYLYDIGIAKQLREVSTPALSVVDTLASDLRSGLGGLIENAVYLNLMSGKGFLKNISGYKKSSKNPLEIDFIYKIADHSVPLEVKASLKWQPKFCREVIQYLEATKQQLGIVVSGAPFEIFNHGKSQIINLPFYLCSPEVIDKLL